jgi:hypothetical protein
MPAIKPEELEKTVARVTGAEAYYAGTLVAFLDMSDEAQRVATEAAGDVWAQIVTAFLEGCTSEGLEKASLSVTCDMLDDDGNVILDDKGAAKQVPAEPLQSRAAYRSAKSTYKSAKAAGVLLIDAEGKIRSKTLVGAQALAKAAGIELLDAEGKEKKTSQLNKERKALAEEDELDEAPVSAPFRQTDDATIARVFFARTQAADESPEEQARARAFRAMHLQELTGILNQANAEAAQDAESLKASQALARAEHEKRKTEKAAKQDALRTAMVGEKARLRAEYEAAGYTVSDDDVLELAADELDGGTMPEGAAEAMREQLAA